jgi:hypothetical protein
MSIEYIVVIITVTTTTIPTHKTITTSFVVVLVTSTSLSLFLVKGLKQFQLFLRPFLHTYLRHFSFCSTAASVFRFPLLI